MLLKLFIYFTISLLVLTTKYRFLGVMYIQLWEIALVLCLLFWLYHIATTKKINIKLDSLNIALFVFLLINIFSSIRMPEHAGAFMSGGTWYNLRTIEPVLLYIIISDHLATKKNIKPFICCLLAVLFMECLLGLAQSLFSFEWPSMSSEFILTEYPRAYLYYLIGYGNPLVKPAYGTFEHFNSFGMYLTMFVPLLLSFVFIEKMINRKLAIVLASLTITTLILTYSRGALLGTIVGLFSLFLIWKRYSPGVLFLSFLIFATVIIAIQIFIGGYYKESLNLAGRLEIWDKVLNIIFQNPFNFILGTGSGTHLYWTQYENQGHLYTPHNAYLMIWLETGLLGILSFLSIFVIFYLKSLKTFLTKSSSLYNGIIFSMLGIIPSLLVQYCFAIGFAELWFKTLTMFFIAIGLSAINQVNLENRYI